MRCASTNKQQQSSQNVTIYRLVCNDNILTLLSIITTVASVTTTSSPTWLRPLIPCRRYQEDKQDEKSWLGTRNDLFEGWHDMNFLPSHKAIGESFAHCCSNDMHFPKKLRLAFVIVGTLSAKTYVALFIVCTLVGVICTFWPPAT